MEKPCKHCPIYAEIEECTAQYRGYAGCGLWQRWFLDAWGSARIGVLANAMGYEKSARSTANTANGKDKTTTHIIAEEG